MQQPDLLHGTIPSAILRQCLGPAIRLRSTILDRIKRRGPDWCNYVRLKDGREFVDDQDGMPFFTMDREARVSNRARRSTGAGAKVFAAARGAEGPHKKRNWRHASCIKLVKNIDISIDFGRLTYQSPKTSESCGLKRQTKCGDGS
jgi:hypothetical protein